MTELKIYDKQHEIITQESKPYHYRECGLDNIFLKNGFEIEVIDGETYTSIEDIDSLHEKIALLLVEKPAALTGKEFRFLREQMDQSRKNLAQLFGNDQQTIGRWENGEAKIPVNFDAIIRQIFLESINKNSVLSNHLKRLAHAESKAYLEEIVLEAKKHAWLKVASEYI